MSSVKMVTIYCSPPRNNATEIFQRKRERVDRAECHRQRPRQFLSRELAECLLSNALLRKDVLYIPPGTWFRQFLCGGC